MLLVEVAEERRKDDERGATGVWQGSDGKEVGVRWAVGEGATRARRGEDGVATKGRRGEDEVATGWRRAKKVINSGERYGRVRSWEKRRKVMYLF